MSVALIKILPAYTRLSEKTWNLNQCHDVERRLVLIDESNAPSQDIGKIARGLISTGIRNASIVTGTDYGLALAGVIGHLPTVAGRRALNTGQYQRNIHAIDPLFLLDRGADRRS